MKIKLCGMFREEDISYANEARPDFIGFIINFPKSRRNVDLDRAERLRSLLSSEIRAVGVFVDESPEVIIEGAKRGIFDLIQLHGNEKNSEISYLKNETKLPVIKAVKVQKNTDFLSGNSAADFILFDSGNGTGKPFDHDLLNENSINKPYFLAGGITPENISEITKKFTPYALDLSSGIEENGVKNREKMIAAVRAARGV